jgi:hypothetical protein
LRPLMPYLPIEVFVVKILTTLLFNTFANIIMTIKFISALNKCCCVAGATILLVSYFYPVVPSQMTSAEGHTVKHWSEGCTVHPLMAVGPLLNILNAITAGRECYDDHSDCYRWAKNKALKELLLSIPVSLGWFAIWFFPFLGIPYKNKLFVLSALVAILLSIPILSIDFYKHASTYQPYFHLGVGAYLIVIGFFFSSVGVFLGLISSLSSVLADRSG